MRPWRHAGGRTCGRAGGRAGRGSADRRDGQVEGSKWLSKLERRKSGKGGAGLSGQPAPCVRVQVLACVRADGRARVWMDARVRAYASCCRACGPAAKLLSKQGAPFSNRGELPAR
eukprot:6197204-Pleurochrysis_carterae.AAC.1